MTGIHILGDWGSSRLRLFRCVDGVVTDRIEGTGIASLNGPAAAELRRAIAPWRKTGEVAAITLCGMVGSRNGLIEVPYAACPANALDWLKKAVRLPFDGGILSIMAGLSGVLASGAPDIMRGEETQIFGAMTLNSAAGQGCSLIVLPGTHSKWVQLENGKVIGFRTFLTGEIFASLRAHSLLTRAADDEVGASDDEQAGFAHGLLRAREGQLLGAMFEARSAQLQLGRSRAWALGYLSGLLLGREVAEAINGDTLPPITVIGDPLLTTRYARAFDTRGLDIMLLDGDACVLAGLGLLDNVQ